MNPIILFKTKTVSIFESRDDGASFSVVGPIANPEFAQGLCFGTILWAGSAGQDARPSHYGVDRGREFACHAGLFEGQSIAAP